MPLFRRFILTVCLGCATLLVAGATPPATRADDAPKNNGVEETIIETGLYALFHHQVRCKITQAGWMEPTQGVWQDDNFFVDLPGKQLTQVDPRTYVAELEMAEFRDTLLYGIYRPAGQTPNDRRNTIAVFGESWYSNPVPVKLRFTLTQPDVPARIIYETPVQYVVNIGGRCNAAPTPFSAVLDASKGIPPVDPFVFSHDGAYAIKAELYDAKDRATGLYTQVSGRVVSTHGPTVMFVPVYSQKAEDATGLVYPTNRSMTLRAESLARYVSRYGPMYFPLEADAIGAVVRAPRDVSASLARARAVAESHITGWKRYLIPLAHLTGASTGNAEPEVVEAQLLQEFDGIAGLGHVGRLIVLNNGSLTGLTHDDAAAFTYSTKTIFAHDTISFLSVLHEIVHTEPVYLWSSPGMIAECKDDYHDNNGGTVTRGGVATHVRGIVNGKVTGVAYGVRTQHVLDFEAYDLESDPGTGAFTMGGVTVRPPTGDEAKAFHGEGVPQLRQRMDASYEVMGSEGTAPDIPDFRWITQCTYHHLVDDALQQSQDPHYLLARMVIAHRGAWAAGYFEPIYDVEDDAIQARQQGGAWNVTALDANGATVATYGFEPIWRGSDNARDRTAIPVTARIPYDDRIRRLELRSPAGVLATQTIGASPPSLQIDSPVDGASGVGRTVVVRWSATTAAGATALATVYYSVDGKIWLDRAFETKQTSLRLILAKNAARHYIRVVVTDGSRSAERTVVVSS